MAITRIQETSTHGLSSSPSVTYSSTTTAGNLLVAVLAAYDENIQGPYPTGWNLATQNTNETNAGIFVCIMYAANAVAQNTVTFALTGSGRWMMFVAEYSGIQAATPLDQNNYVNTPSGNPVTGNITTGYSSSLIIGALSTDGSTTWSSPTNSFNLVDQENGGAQSSACYLDYIALTSGTYSSSASGASGGNGVIANFIASGASFSGTDDISSQLPIKITDGTNTVALIGSAYNITGTVSSSGEIVTDESSLTQGTSLFSPYGGYYADSATVIASAAGAIARITQYRAYHTNLRTSGGVELGTTASPLYVTGAVTSTGTITIVPPTTQTIAGTITTIPPALTTVAGTITTVASSGTKTVQTPATQTIAGTVTTVPTAVTTVAGTVTTVASSGTQTVQTPGTQTVVGTVTEIAGAGTETIAGTLSFGSLSTDESADTQGSSGFQLNGGYYADSATAIASGAGAIIRLTQYRGYHVNLRTSAGVEIGTSTSPVSVTGTMVDAGTITVVPPTTQTIAGTVTTVPTALTTVAGTVTTVASSGTQTIQTPATQTIAGTVTTVPTAVTTVAGTVTTVASSGTKTVQTPATQTVAGTVTTVSSTNTLTIVGTLTSTGSALTDEVAITQGSSPLNLIGGYYADSATAIASGAGAIVRITQYRGVHVNPRDSSGNELGSSNPLSMTGTITSAGTITVVPPATQTVAGTVTTVASSATQTIQTPATQTINGTVTTVPLATQTIAGTVTTVASSATRTVQTPGTQTIVGTVTEIAGSGTETVVGNLSFAIGLNADETAVTQGTTPFQFNSGFYADSATAIASGAGAIVRITQYRGIHVNLRDSSGNELGSSNPLSITGTLVDAGTITVVPPTTQTVAGTVTTVPTALTTVAGTVTTVASSATRTIQTPATQTIAGTVTTVPTAVTTVAGTVTTVASSGTQTIQTPATQTVSGTVTTVSSTNTLTIVGTLTSTGSALTDEVAITQGSSPLNLIGGYYADSATAIASGAGAIVRITQYRGVHVNLRTAVGVEIGTTASPASMTGTITNTGTLTVVPTATQTIAGTVTTVPTAVTTVAGTVTTVPTAVTTVAGTVTTVASSGTQTVATPGTQTVAGTVTEIAGAGTETITGTLSFGSLSTDESADTQGSSGFQLNGGYYADSATAIASGAGAIIRLTQYRGYHVNLRNATAGAEFGTTTTPMNISGTVIDAGTVTASAVATQTVGGTVTTVPPALTTLAGTVTTVVSSGTRTVQTPATQTVAGTVTTVPPSLTTVAGTITTVPPALTTIAGTVTIVPSTGTETIIGTITNIPTEISTGLLSTGNGIVYADIPTIANASTGTILYTVTSGKTLYLKSVIASSSGAPCKVSVVAGTTTLAVGFYSTAFPYINIPFSQPVSIAASTVVAIQIQNNAGLTQDVYGALTGHEQ